MKDKRESGTGRVNVQNISIGRCVHRNPGNEWAFGLLVAALLALFPAPLSALGVLLPKLDFQPLSGFALLLKDMGLLAPSRQSVSSTAVLYRLISGRFARVGTPRWA
jgi:hypothetical protein